MGIRMLLDIFKTLFEKLQNLRVGGLVSVFEFSHLLADFFHPHPGHGKRFGEVLDPGGRASLRRGLDAQRVISPRPQILDDHILVFYFDEALDLLAVLSNASNS